jgi:hypothetical protein
MNAAAAAAAKDSDMEDEESVYTTAARLVIESSAYKTHMICVHCNCVDLVRCKRAATDEK